MKTQTAYNMGIKSWADASRVASFIFFSAVVRAWPATLDLSNYQLLFLVWALVTEAGTAFISAFTNTSPLVAILFKNKSETL